MFPSKKKLKTLLKNLKQDDTESATVDVKADLPLDTLGDRAFFIRHIAALANNREPSYLVIGVQDKTWGIEGIPEDSTT